MAIDGAEDAAAVGGDLRVGRAGQAPSQFVAAIAGEHGVGVRIDEAGHDGAAERVDDDGVRRRAATSCASRLSKPMKTIWPR